jgi:hypothetical protein
VEIKDIDALYEELREARAFMEALNDGILSVRIKRDEYKWMIPDESDTSFKSFCDCWERWTTLAQKVFEKINGSFLFLDDAFSRPFGIELPEPNEREILSIMRRNGEEYSAKLLIKAINLEKVLHDKKKASVSPTKETTDAQNTAGTGRCDDYTTAPRQIQGGI